MARAAARATDQSWNLAPLREQWVWTDGPVMMTERVQVAVIGAGRIGRHHARTVASHVGEAALAAMVDADETVVREAAAAFGCSRWTTKPGDIFNDEAVRAVVIASPTNTHARLIIEAAAAGKDIFCEKPIALSLEETDAALAAVADAGVRLQIGFQRRFDKGYQRASQLIASGALGKVEAIRDTMRDPSPASREYIVACGGLFRDMTIHNFDCVRWLMGDEPTEVYAIGAALVDPMFAELDDIDTGIVTLRFRNGSIASIDNGRRSGFGYDVRTEVFGSEGALFIGYARETPLLHLARDGVSSDHVAWFLDRFDQAYVDELRDFVQAIVDDRPVRVTGEDGRAAMVLAYAAEAARRENRPVEVSRFASPAPHSVGKARFDHSFIPGNASKGPTRLGIEAPYAPPPVKFSIEG